jgi:Zn-dependent protease
MSVFGGGKSLQLFKVRGIRVGVHPTWFLILLLFLVWLKPSFDNAIITEGQGFLAAVLAAFLFFGSIVLHELGHAFAARREGIGVGGVDLFFFGGFMRAMRDSETPGEEFRVAAAGPAVTLLLAVGFGVAGYVMLGDSTRLLDAATFEFASGSLVEVLVAFTALANAALFILNMVPAFPLDGGRITRAIVWQLSGDRHKATRLAAYLGQAFAVLMMGYGVYVFLNSDDQTGGLWWVVLGWMLGGAARAAVAQSRFADRLVGVTAGDIMDADPVSIPAELSIERAYDEFFLRYQGWPWFAVTEEDGRLTGIAHRAAVEHAVHEEDPAQPVRAVATDSDHVRIDTPLESLIGNEPLRTLGALMAVDAEGHLRGVVTVEQVSRALQARLA